MFPLRKVLVVPAAAAAAFVVHGIAWNALPFANTAVHALDSPNVLEALATLPATGTHFVNSNASRDGLAVAGAPHGWLTLHAPESYSASRSLALSALLHLACAWLAAYVVRAVRRPRFSGRFVAASAVSMFGIVAGPVWDGVWGWYSPEYAAVMALHAFVACAAMSAVLATFLRPEPLESQHG
jgi:hypothetical protein